MSDARRQHRHSLPAAFACAIGGVWFLLRTERNPRIQLAFAVIAVALGAWLGITSIEWAVIVLCIGLVLGLETVNTAIERAVDHTSLEKHPLAKQAKDLAAAAVLIAAGASVCVGLIIFLPRLLAH
jgi:diacylglycerol kinase